MAGEENGLLSFIIYENSNLYDSNHSISCSSSGRDENNMPLTNGFPSFMFDHGTGELPRCLVPSPPPNARVGGGGGRKRRRKRARACKNTEEAEAQRMTHINVERNRRKLMNEHLSVLRSLMPESYVQRGDQASIVGGAIQFVKELEHHLQSLEAKKLRQDASHNEENDDDNNNNNNTNMENVPFAQFFAYPQYTWSQVANKFAACTRAEGVADVEVTLIETHASLRILFRRCLVTRQLSHLVAGIHSLSLSILHLTITSAHPLVLYSINAKVEEGCEVTSVDDISAAVHNMLTLIQQEAALC